MTPTPLHAAASPLPPLPDAVLVDCDRSAPNELYLPVSTCWMQSPWLSCASNHPTSDDDRPEFYDDLQPRVRASAAVVAPLLVDLVEPRCIVDDGCVARRACRPRTHGRRRVDFEVPEEKLDIASEQFVRASSGRSTLGPIIDWVADERRSKP